MLYETVTSLYTVSPRALGPFMFLSSEHNTDKSQLIFRIFA